MNTQVANFFVEMFNRIRTESPKIFTVLQIIFASLTLLGYLPITLKNWFNVDVPDHFVTMCKDIAKYSTGIFVGCLFPVKQPLVAQTEEGEGVKVINEKKMPFTANAEAKAIHETNPPPPVVDVPHEKENP